MNLVICTSSDRAAESNEKQGRAGEVVGSWHVCGPGRFVLARQPVFLMIDETMLFTIAFFSLFLCLAHFWFRPLLSDLVNPRWILQLLRVLPLALVTTLLLGTTSPWLAACLCKPCACGQRSSSFSLAFFHP